MLYILLALLVVLAIGALAVIFSRLQPQAKAPRLPYVKKSYLLTKAEKAFYGVLLQAAPEDYVVLLKVRLADVLDVERGANQPQGHRNRIDRKHLDLLLCDKQRLEPQVAIELDDASHQRQHRQDRDAFLDGACAVAGLPLLRIPAQKSYHLRELQSAIQSHLGSHLPPNTEPREPRTI
ncbi:MAG: DUF2726 domain-containing protein [Phycisphaerae bacterium]|nr:DUF2726 domain-containing protein [Phycisphaerae bacterium]